MPTARPGTHDDYTDQNDNSVGRAEAIGALDGHVIALTRDGRRYQLHTGDSGVVIQPTGDTTSDEDDPETGVIDYQALHTRLRSGHYYQPEAPHPAAHQLVDTIVDAPSGGDQR